MPAGAMSAVEAEAWLAKRDALNSKRAAGAGAAEVEARDAAETVAVIAPSPSPRDKEQS
jgi:hypothetical protein